MKRCSTSLINRKLQIITQQNTTSYQSGLVSNIQQISCAGEDVEKGNTYVLLMGMQIGATTVEKSMRIPQKIKNRSTIDAEISLPGYLSRVNKDNNLFTF